MTGADRRAGLGPYGLGTAPLAGLFSPVSEVDTEQTLAAAWAAGIRYGIVCSAPAFRPG